MSVNRILIFASEASIDPALVEALSKRGCQTYSCDDVARAAIFFATAQIDIALIYLDQEPGDAGLALLEKVRELSSGIPVLIVTRTAAVELRVQGLNLGAVDYLIQPLDADYLWTRLITAVRRRTTVPLRLLRRGNVVLDVEAGRLGDGNRWTRLTPTERQALSVLFESGDRPVSKGRIKAALEDGDSLSDNAIEVVIYRLRNKAHDWGMQIRACRGMGYILEDV